MYILAHFHYVLLYTSTPLHFRSKYCALLFNILYFLPSFPAVMECNWVHLLKYCAWCTLLEYLHVLLLYTSTPLNIVLFYWTYYIFCILSLQWWNVTEYIYSSIVCNVHYLSISVFCYFILLLHYISEVNIVLLTYYIFCLLSPQWWNVTEYFNSSGSCKYNLELFVVYLSISIFSYFIL